MKEVKLYRFLPEQTALNERFDILDFSKCESDIRKYPVYKESYYCFLLIERGDAELIVDGQKANIKGPILVCSLPGDTWEWKHWENIHGKFLCFDAETLMSGLRGGYSLDPIPFLNPEQRFPFIPLSEERLKRLRLLAEDMEECVNDCPIHYDLLRGELWQFVFLAEKEYALNGNTGRKKEQKNHLMHFIKLVNLHFSSHHDVQFYANELHITPNYLNKICKSLLGISAFDYITNRIVSEAKTLLRLTKISVSEISYMLGYENPSYFIKIFKNKEGITPLEFHKKGTL